MGVRASLYRIYSINPAGPRHFCFLRVSWSADTVRIMGRLYIGRNHQGSPALVGSIFRLVGSDEDALTFGLGFMLADSPSFCVRVLRMVGAGIRYFTADDYSVHLQEVTAQGFGRRDVVIESGPSRVVLEAKIGSSEPSAEQLIKYGSEWEVWNSFRRRVIVSLTQVKLPVATEEEVRSELAQRGIQFRAVQWHQILDLVLGYGTDDEPSSTRFLFDEFIRYIRSDFRMGYHDAEVLVQDVNPLNKRIFEDGWMYVTALHDKRAPLYFAPYFTRQGNNSGITMIARVMDSEVAVLPSKDDVVAGAGGEHLEKWRYGLRKLRKRAKKEEFDDRPVRLFYLDRPITFRSEPLSKKDSREPDSKLSKQIPSQIPKGFSLGFDDLLRS